MSDGEASSRLDTVEEQTALLAHVAANLVAISTALTMIVANLRAEVYKGIHDPRLPDIEKDLERIKVLIDETWPPSR